MLTGRRVPQLRGASGSAPSEPTVEIVILNWNTWPLVGRGLSVLRGAAVRDDVTVTVVDNCSDDDGAGVKSKFPWVRFERLDSNAGYAGGNNFALEKSRAEFILLQNSDAFPTVDAVDTLVHTLRQRPSAAAIAPALVDATGVAQVGAYGYRSSLRRWMVEVSGLSALPGFGEMGIWGRRITHAASGGAIPVDWVSGACLLLRAQAVRDVGRLDDSYFMYMEDMEWCARARRRGWDVLYLPTIRVTHLFASSQSLGAAGWIYSLMRLLRREYSALAARAVACVGLIGFAWRAGGAWVLSLFWPGQRARLRRRASAFLEWARGFARTLVGPVL